MKAYCLGCLYCRPLSRGNLMHACHLYLDERIKPDYDEHECRSRRLVSSEERAAYIAAMTNTDYLVPPKKRRVEDDYIFDDRGALDGWYPVREE